MLSVAVDRRSSCEAAMLTGPVERAFVLAKTGRFRNKSEIARAMLNEGYSLSDLAYLEGPSLSRQIASLCALSRNTLH